jgi:hypothetical protein
MDPGEKEEEEEEEEEEGEAEDEENEDTTAARQDTETRPPSEARVCQSMYLVITAATRQQIQFLNTEQRGILPTGNNKGKERIRWSVLNLLNGKKPQPVPECQRRWYSDAKRSCYRRMKPRKVG